MNYNWCHNPNCHKIKTQSRVRGTGDNKVLRTRKIKVHNPNDTNVWDYFCNQSCLFGFINHYLNELVNIKNERGHNDYKNRRHNHRRYWQNWHNF